jgi:hypothetical protein
MMMVEGTLQAMDRWIELMSELDRHHDLALAQAARRRRCLASPEPRSVSPDPARSDVEGKLSPRNPLKSPKPRKNVAVGVTAPSNPARGEVEGKFFALQPLEIAQNREGISKSPRRSGTPLDLAEAGPRPRERLAQPAPTLSTLGSRCRPLPSC